MNIPKTIKAYVVQLVHEIYKGKIEHIELNSLPKNEVLVKVQYSSINYKDALSATGKNSVTKSYPHIPGIDAVGQVISDSTKTYSVNETVIVTGHDLGTNTYGGYAEYISVPVHWVVPLPIQLTPQQSMLIGTAGFTAMYGIKRLEREQITPSKGPVLVTGATGGVGSMAVYFLAQLGYEVVAATQKTNSHEFLRTIGANKIINTEFIYAENDNPLLKRRWAACIETVGGSLLDSILRQIYDKGAVACCGNILGQNFSTSIYPFILRGISLLGIDSAYCEYDLRLEIWNSLSNIDFNKLPNSFITELKLDSINKHLDSILNGMNVGRTIVQI